MLGFVRESLLPTHYQAANVSIVPSQSLEGFGLTTVESLACGTPVLVTPVGGLTEVVGPLAPSCVLCGWSPDQIAEGLQAAYVKGVLPKRDIVSFAYMWSADQSLGSGIGHWHPHMMVFCPYYENSMVGGNEFGSPLPQVSDDAGTPFTVVVIPIDDRLAVKARAK